MQRSTLLLAVALAAALVIHLRARTKISAQETPRKISPGIDVSPVCPWRDPQHDLSALFLPATNYVLDTRILSGMTAEIVKRLGRQMNTDENPLRIHRVQSDGHAIGSVLVTRVKGEHGGIELVIGTGSDGAVKGVLIQSQREPEEIARAIVSSNFLAAFVGKNSSSPLRIGEDLPEVAKSAHMSAQAIADGVRNQLIALSFAERLASARQPETQAPY